MKTITFGTKVRRKPCGRICEIDGLARDGVGAITKIRIRETAIRWCGWVTHSTFLKKWDVVS